MTLGGLESAEDLMILEKKALWELDTDSEPAELINYEWSKGQTGRNMTFWTCIFSLGTFLLHDILTKTTKFKMNACRFDRDYKPKDR